MIPDLAGGGVIAAANPIGPLWWWVAVIAVVTVVACLLDLVWPDEGDRLDPTKVQAYAAREAKRELLRAGMREG